MDQIGSLHRRVVYLAGSAIQMAVLERRNCTEYFLCGPADIGQVIGMVEGEQGQVIAVDVFAPQEPSLLSNYPVAHLVSTVSGLGGVCLRAIKGPQIRRLQAGQRSVGTYWEDPEGRYLVLAGIRPQDHTVRPAEQARSIFEQMELTLRQNGMTFRDVIRTWFYNDQITCWYDEFNQVRNEFFRQTGVFEGLVPASTGIGIRNACGAAVVGGLFALQAKKGTIQAHAVRSPMQGPALEYGSSFSRAVEVNWPDHRRLFISGTASIDIQGRTCHVGDPVGQIDLTLQVIERLLASSGYGWSDVVRAVAYLKDPQIVPVLQQQLSRWPGCKDMPIVLAQAEICRQDLLFEMECEAIQA